VAALGNARSTGGAPLGPGGGGTGVGVTVASTSRTRAAAPPLTPPTALVTSSAAVIAARVREAEAHEATVAAAREAYRGPPARAAALWLVVSALPRLSPTYQTSLAAVKAMFARCVSAAATASAGASSAAAAGGGRAGGGGSSNGGGSALGGAARPGLDSRLAGLTASVTAHIHARVRRCLWR
jgi:hypothetical protein